MNRYERQSGTMAGNCCTNLYIKVEGHRDCRLENAWAKPPTLEVLVPYCNLTRSRCIASELMDSHSSEGEESSRRGFVKIEGKRARGCPARDVLPNSPIWKWVVGTAPGALMNRSLNLCKQRESQDGE